MLRVAVVEALSSRKAAATIMEAMASVCSRSQSVAAAAAAEAAVVAAADPAVVVEVVAAAAVILAARRRMTRTRAACLLAPSRRALSRPSGRPLRKRNGPLRCRSCVPTSERPSRTMMMRRT